MKVKDFIGFKNIQTMEYQEINSGIKYELY